MPRFLFSCIYMPCRDLRGYRALRCAVAKYLYTGNGAELTTDVLRGAAKRLIEALSIAEDGRYPGTVIVGIPDVHGATLLAKAEATAFAQVLELEAWGLGDRVIVVVRRGDRVLGALEFRLGEEFPIVYLPRLRIA